MMVWPAASSSMMWSAFSCRPKRFSEARTSLGFLTVMSGIRIPFAHTSWPGVGGRRGRGALVFLLALCLGCGAVGVVLGAVAVGAAPAAGAKRVGLGKADGVVERRSWVSAAPARQASGFRLGNAWRYRVMPWLPSCFGRSCRGVYIGRIASLR